MKLILKFNVAMTLLILFIVCSYTNTTRTRSKSRSRMKKLDTILEFYNDLFSKKGVPTTSSINSNKDINLSKLNSEIKKLQSKNFRNQRFKILGDNKTTSKDPEKQADSKATQLENDTSTKNKLYNNKKEKVEGVVNDSNPILLEGWYKISSSLFKVHNLFPPIKIVVKNLIEKTIHIKSDHDDYRINEYNEIHANEQLDIRDFYFRVTEDFLYYSIDQNDVNILQTIRIQDIFKLNQLDKEYENMGKEIFFFRIILKQTKFDYKFASYDNLKLMKFNCQLASLLSVRYEYCEKANFPNVIDPVVIHQEVIVPTIIVPLPSKECNDKWDYVNKGDDWECSCKEGALQSPIDLPDKKDALLSPVTPLFSFTEVRAKNIQSTIDGAIKAEDYNKIKYMDHALRILHPNLGKIVTLNGAIYIAEEITFHTPSEHTISGKRFDMEMQVTFYGQSKGDIAKQVVLSFLFKKKAGYYNKFLDDIDFYSLPNKSIREKDILNNLFIPKVFYSSTGEDDVDDNLLTLKPFSFYTYEGSLTMPPCTENTIHYVAAEPIPIASVILDMARESLKNPDVEMVDEEKGETTRVFDTQDKVENYRNIQDRRDRNVFYFDHERYCGKEVIQTKREEPMRGHYEKIKRKMRQYIYVPGSRPSYIPGSYVVSEKEALGLYD